MRRSLPRIATFMVVAFAVTTLSFTGCQTGSSFKMPGSDWVSSWGKKKSPKTALSSTKPNTKLPAPPSTTATPYQAPSYAQGPGARSGYGTNGWGGAQGAPVATNAQQYQGYGTQANNGYYSNSNNTTAPGYQANYDRAAANPSYATSGADAARGFYSPSYNGGSAQQPTPGLRSAGPATHAGSYRSNTYTSQAQNTYSASSNPPATGQTWTDGTRNAGQYAGAARSQYDPRSQAQPTRNTPAYNYDSQNSTGGGGHYDRAPSPLGGSSSGEYSRATSQYQHGLAPTRGTGNTPRNATPGTIADAYRPGSTARSTQFGNSENINVGNARGIQPAWFGDAGDGTARTSVSDTGVGQPAAGSSTRTATGPYPYTTPNNYR